MLPAGVVEPPAERVERLGAGGLRRLQPCLEHQVGELALLLQAAEDGADLADDQLEHRDLLFEQRQHLLLQRAARDQIEHEHLAVLADAVDAADALLDRHRVPGHVEVDQGVAELDVAPLAARLRAQQDRGMVAKLGDGRVLLRAAQAAVEAREGQAGLGKTIGDMGERLAGMHEDELLLLRIALHEFDQRRLLAAPPDRGPAFGETAPTPDRRRCARRSGAKALAAAAGEEPAALSR